MAASCPGKLTTHLLALSTPRPYSSAVEHPFLTAAGNGTLPHDRLALWLSQDRIYAAHAYPLFIGRLISQIPFSSSHGLNAPEESKNQQILKILSFSLENVVREAEFFKDTSKKWDLPIECWMERKATRDYTAEMARVSGKLEDGLVFLWAMEKVYLDAWSHVRSLLGTAAPSTPTSSAALSFAINWSNQEFIRFVDELAALVDDLGISPDSEAWKKAEEIWARVIELEETFWPCEGEELAKLLPEKEKRS